MSDAVHSVVVSCLVRNLENKILLIRHHKRGWEIPQGRVEAGEDLLTALRREVEEEAGILIDPGALATIWSMISTNPAVIFCFLGHYRGGELNPTGDSVEAGWFLADEALQLVTGSVMHDRLVLLLNFDGSVSYRSYTTRPYRVVSEMKLGG